MNNKKAKKERKEMRKAAKEYAMKAETELAKEKYYGVLYRLIKQRTVFQILFFLSLGGNIVLFLYLIGIL